MSHFNSAASHWDSPVKVSRVHELGNSIKDHSLFLEKTELDVLDFGCGTGLLGLEFSQIAKTILGVDNSQGMLEVFDAKTKDFPNFNSLNIDLEERDLDQKFDLIVSSMTFHHLVNPSKMILKFSKMLKEGGLISLIDLETEDGTFHKDNGAMGVKHFGFSQEEIRLWAASANLSASYEIVERIEKNERVYNLFLANFK